jgi:hypothetical protein
MVKMRIKRNLNFNRNGTTEQPQMRSSKYQSMKEGTRQMPNKNGPKKAIKHLEHIEGDQSGLRSRKKSVADKKELDGSEISAIKISSLALPQENEGTYAENIYNESNTD